MAAPLIGDTHYCGTDIPDMFESTGHNLFVRFKTDYDVGKRGFEIVVDQGIFFRALTYFKMSKNWQFGVKFS